MYSYNYHPYQNIENYSSLKASIMPYPSQYSSKLTIVVKLRFFCMLEKDKQINDKTYLGNLGNVSKDHL